MIKQIIKATAVLACSAGIFSGCADSFLEAEKSEDFNGERSVTLVTTGDRIYARAVTAPASDRLQFKLTLPDTIPEGTEFGFYMTYNNYGDFPSDTKVIVRDGAKSPYTKWTTNLGAKITSGSDDVTGWYPVTVKASNSTKEIGFTVNGTFAKDTVIAIKGITIAQSFNESDWKRFETNTEFSFTKKKPAEFNKKPEANSGSGTNPGGDTPVIIDPVNPSGNIDYIGIRYSKSGVKDKNWKGVTPTMSQWQDYMGAYAKKVPGAKRMFVFIVNSIHDYDGKKGSQCEFRFKKPNSSAISGKYVKYTDSNSEDSLCDEFLSMCDTNGIDVWLQVEPGYNDLVDMANTVLNRFKSHKCVKGFGVDLEWWYRETKVSGGSDHQGKNIDAKETQRVLSAVTNINSDYSLFIKHYSLKYMPKYSDISSDNKKKMTSRQNNKEKNNP